MKKNEFLFDFDQPIKAEREFNDRLTSFENAFSTPLKLSLFDDNSIYNSGRSVEDVTIDSDNVICTTYFNTKKDPQRETKVQLDDIQFISPWYYSLLELGLFGIVFHDNLSNEFIDLYQTDKIKFVKCTLGNYSLNDERFILYYMFFLKHKKQNLFLTDGNDVIINKNPFTLIKSKPKTKIFVGRGKENKLYQSEWNLNSIDRLTTALNVKLSNNFYEMSIYNAGIIGGNYLSVMLFLRQMCSVFFRINNDLNNNMASMHYVLYHYFFPNCRAGFRGVLYNLTPISFKLIFLRALKKSKLDILRIDKINYNNDKIALSKHIVSGFPLNSRFYHFDQDSRAYFNHK